MTLEQAREILLLNQIPFEEQEFSSEAQYNHHNILYPHAKSNPPGSVIALVIPSQNSRKNLELQFTSAGNGFRFAELWFGEYTFELFDMEEGFLEAELLDIIRQTRSGNLQVIVANDLGRKRWLWDAAFHMSEDYTDFAAVLERIQKPKSLWDKLTKRRIQYEIYNWNTYRCILK